MTQLEARIALRRYASDPRPKVRWLASVIHHQIRAAATTSSATLHDVLAENFALLREIAK